MAVLLVLTSVTHAVEPLFIYLHEMMEQSKTIVVAEFLGNADGTTDTDWMPRSVKLKVQEVLKGEVTENEITVDPAQGTIYLETGNTYLAFINAQNEFEWYGHALNGGNLKEDVLMLEGFYDYNAYLVSPGVVSYTNVVQYIAEEQMTGTVTGNIHFFNPRSRQMEPSDMSITVNYTYTARSGVISSVSQENIPLTDFETATAYLGSWDPVISVYYEENLVRPFKLEGELTGVDGSDFTAIFWVEAPEELNENELRQYLQDPALGPPVYQIQIDSDNGETYLLERQSSPSSSVLHNGDKSWDFSSSDDPTNEHAGYIEWRNGMVMNVDPGKDGEYGFTYEKLVRGLRMGSLTGTITYPNSETPVAFEMKLLETTFSDNPNFGK